eukprot:Skav216617  [mRNA]  locus=scaffold2940:182733:183287:+ [translate_table: standard]
MTADPLTKPMIQAGLMLLLAAGLVRFGNQGKRKMTTRVLPSMADYDERDLTKTDSEIMEMATRSSKNKLTRSYSAMLLGFPLAPTSGGRAVLFVTIVLIAAHGHRDGNDESTSTSTTATSYIPIYIVVLLANVATKFVDKTWKRWATKMRRLTVKKEKDSDDDEVVPMIWIKAVCIMETMKALR